MFEKSINTLLLKDSMNRSKAFFVNGGYGRMISSIPAFELYTKTEQDPNFIIVCEGGTDAFKGHPELDHRAYDSWHKNLFREAFLAKSLLIMRKRSGLS